MGATIGTLFRDIGTDLLLVGGGIVFLGIVILAIMNATSIFDEHLTQRVKGGIVKLLWTAVMLGSAGAIASFVGSKVALQGIVFLGGLAGLL